MMLKRLNEASKIVSTSYFTSLCNSNSRFIFEVLPRLEGGFIMRITNVFGKNRALNAFALYVNKSLSKLQCLKMGKKP